MTFDVFDKRSGDAYTIEIERGEFLSATRTLDQLGKEVIVYTSLEEVPQPTRSEIENYIAWNKQSFRRL